MVATAPHFLLLAETQSYAEESRNGGFWRFVLQQVDGSEYLEVSDNEPDITGERLQLLAVIRAFEAIGQPSRVTLVTGSQYVIRGIRRDLDTWREMNWMWERFGELHAIKHAPLWQRLDRALQFHTVQCRAWRFVSDLEPTPVVKRAAGVPAGPEANISRAGRSGLRVFDGLIHAARRAHSRVTMESLAANCV
ncbi:MAG: RNase H family protein [Pirellulaceae bacterium]